MKEHELQTHHMNYEEHHHEHRHEKECGCDQEHQEHHEHHEHHKCHEHHGHHEHHHSHGEECGCGHDHDGHHHGHEEVSHERCSLPENVARKVYILENLGCANCAAKMERKINALPEVEAAVITFATKKLVVASDHQEKLLPVLQKICASIESEVHVIPQEVKAAEKKEKKSFFAANRMDILGIGAGAVLFAAGIMMKNMEAAYVNQVVFIIAYLILGLEIIWKALKNLKNGRVFDENFLMSVATIAAFVIGDFAEAVGVMLFYRVGEFFEDAAVERSRSQIMEAVDLRPEVVNLVEGEAVREIPADEAKAGDVIMIRPGDRIPLDFLIPP